MRASSFQATVEDFLHSKVDKQAVRVRWRCNEWMDLSLRFGNILHSFAPSKQRKHNNPLLSQLHKWSWKTSPFVMRGPFGRRGCTLQKNMAWLIVECPESFTPHRRGWRTVAVSHDIRPIDFRRCWIELRIFLMRLHINTKCIRLKGMCKVRFMTGWRWSVIKRRDDTEIASSHFFSPLLISKYSTQTRSGFFYVI